MRLKECHIIGLQRSGTNYLQELIQDNFSNVSVFGNNCEDYIWKHSPTTDFKKFPEYIVHIYKHPLMWVESCIQCSLYDFLESIPKSDDSLQINGIHIKGLIDLYNQSMNNWLFNFKLNIPIINIQYEKILEKNEIEIFFSKLENVFYFKRDNKNIFLPKLGYTYYSTYDYPSDYLDKYKKIDCKILSEEEQQYVINNTDKKIIELYDREKYLPNT